MSDAFISNNSSFTNDGKSELSDWINSLITEDYDSISKYSGNALFLVSGQFFEYENILLPSKTDEIFDYQTSQTEVNATSVDGCSPKVFGSIPFEDGCNRICYYMKHGDEVSVGSEDNPYKCPFSSCTYSAITKSILSMHIRSHGSEKPLKCSFPNCSYSSSVQSNFKVHLRTHTGERPFKCNFSGCQYASVSSSDLKKHNRVHNHEKPYKCSSSNCKYSCTNKSDLNKHSLIHTVIRPFKCNYPTCTYAANQKVHLMRHQKKHSLSM